MSWFYFWKPLILREIYKYPKRIFRHTGVKQKSHSLTDEYEPQLSNSVGPLACRLPEDYGATALRFFRLYNEYVFTALKLSILTDGYRAAAPE